MKNFFILCFFFIIIQNKLLFSHFDSLKKDNLIDSILFEESLKFADAGIWDAAFEKIENIKNPNAYTLLMWLKLRSGNGNYREYKNFVSKYQNWPGLELINEIGEKKISSEHSSDEIISYFSFFPPKTGYGALRLAISYEKKGMFHNSNKIIRESWVKEKFSNSDFEYISEKYESILKHLNKIRVENLMADNDIISTRQMIPLLNDNYRKLIQTRISIKENASGIDKMIKNLPEDLKLDPGLSYDRFIYRKSIPLHQSAQNYLIEKSEDAKLLGDPMLWIKHRSFYSRLAIKNGEIDKAYNIASNHNVRNIPSKRNLVEIAELEWLSGFIAFNFKKNYILSLYHFKQFSDIVKNPISKAKAAYWIGRCYEKMKKNDKAKNSYGVGAQFQTTFYGQLSAERGSFISDNSIFYKTKVNLNDDDFLFDDQRVSIATLLYFSKRSVLASRFFSHISEELNLTQKLKLAKYIENLNFYGAILSVAKKAVKKGEILPSIYYPIIKELKILPKEKRSIIAAIIRSESEFFPSSISSVGAKGLMQIMPSTGKEIAEKNNLKFQENRLLNDKEFNIMIGHYYLDYLLERFNGSTLLAIASYNAGPGRVESWITQNGDPRSTGVDPLVWIELIPFFETRNYVMRVMEAEWVYDGKFNNYVPELSRGRINFGHKF